MGTKERRRVKAGLILALDQLLKLRLLAEGDLCDLPEL